MMTCFHSPGQSKDISCVEEVLATPESVVSASCGSLLRVNTITEPPNQAIHKMLVSEELFVLTQQQIDSVITAACYRDSRIFEPVMALRRECKQVVDLQILIFPLLHQHRTGSSLPQTRSDLQPSSSYLTYPTKLFNHWSSLSYSTTDF